MINIIKDTVEVDDNVTRHLSSQLLSDWDVLILHYLGMLSYFI